jgi:hypothetical protein
MVFTLSQNLKTIQVSKVLNDLVINIFGRNAVNWLIASVISYGSLNLHSF